MIALAVNRLGLLLNDIYGKSELRIIATGGFEQSPEAEGEFVNAPILNWNDKLKLNSNDIQNSNPNYGSGSLR